MNIKSTLTNNKTTEAFDQIYKKGYDKSYPSIELVRIQNMLIRKKGKVLDYGCGPGTNGIHFLQKKHDVDFADISKFAIKNLKKKLEKNKLSNYKLFKLQTEINKLPFNTNAYNTIICMSLINNLESLKAVKNLINEFSRIIKKNGIMVIDTNLTINNYKIIKRYNDGSIDTYVNDTSKKKMKMFFPKNKKVISKILSDNNFKILDIGSMKFKIFDQFENEVIYTAVKI